MSKTIDPLGSCLEDVYGTLLIKNPNEVSLEGPSRSGCLHFLSDERVFNLEFPVDEVNRLLHWENHYKILCP